MAAGELVRNVRLRHGLTQRQLATRASRSRSTISRVERGLVSPSVDELWRLLDLMGEELILGADPIDYGIDVAELDRNLALTVQERIERMVAKANERMRLARSSPPVH